VAWFLAMNGLKVMSENGLLYITMHTIYDTVTKGTDQLKSILPFTDKIQNKSFYIMLKKFMLVKTRMLFV